MIDNTAFQDCEVPARDLLRFASGDSGGVERQRILEHLLAGCSRCRESLAALQDLRRGEAPAHTDEDGPSISGILASLSERASQIENERDEAHNRLPAFLAHPPARQWTLIRNSRRYDTWSFCAALLEAAFEAIYDDPRRSRDLSEMAIELSSRLDEEAYGQRAVSDLQGRAHAHLGNARRALSDLRGAEEELGAARKLVESGTGDPLEEAELLYFESSLLRAQRKFDAALRRVRRSAKLYREVGDTHLEGRSLAAEGLIQLLRGETAATRACYERAALMIDAERDPRFALAAQHNFVWFLMETGDAASALERLEQIRAEYHNLGDRSSLLKLSWLQARIYDQLGRLEDAESGFRDTIEGFSESELPYEAACASLDLATLLARAGRLREVRQVAADTLVLFQSIGVAREAIAAWMVFQRAAETEAVTVSLIERLARYFTEARLRPELVFET